MVVAILQVSTVTYLFLVLTANLNSDCYKVNQAENLDLNTVDSHPLSFVRGTRGFLLGRYSEYMVYLFQHYTDCCCHYYRIYHSTGFAKNVRSLEILLLQIYKHIFLVNYQIRFAGIIGLHLRICGINSDLPER